MNVEKLGGLLLVGALALVVPTKPMGPPMLQARDDRPAKDEMHEKDELLARLFELQTRVRGGALPTDEELALARTSREQILAGLDVDRATRLGFEPKSVRDRLQPGFFAELELLAAQRSRLEVGPLPEPSPLLTTILDLEQDLWREADRRRQRAGIKSPLDSGPLSRRLEPAAPIAENAGAASGAANGEAAKDAGIPGGLSAGSEPRLIGHAFYKVGRYEEALAAWKDVVPPEGSAGLEFEYQRADCMLRVSRVDDAIAAWEKLAADHPGTSWAAQSEFALRIARALRALREAKSAESQAAGAGKQP